MNILLKSLLSEVADPTVNKTLFKNDWLSLMSTKEDSGGDYIYSHETRCNGNIIAVLLYKRTGKDSWEYGARSEKTPCWGNKSESSALTGGVDSGSTPLKTAIKEVKEESGFVCEEKDLKSLGTCRGTKSTDTLYHLYALDVNNLKQVKPTGEDAGDIIWIKGLNATRSVVCPIFSTMVLRLGF